MYISSYYHSDISCNLSIKKQYKVTNKAMIMNSAWRKCELTSSSHPRFWNLVVAGMVAGMLAEVVIPFILSLFALCL